MGWYESLKLAHALGVSEPQLMIMCIVSHHVPRQRDRFASWVLKAFDHLEHSQTQADLDQAINECTRNGWLRVLTTDNIRRKPPYYSTYLRYFPSSAGQLDWAKNGNLLAKKILGERSVQQGA